MLLASDRERASKYASALADLVGTAAHFAGNAMDLCFKHRFLGFSTVISRFANAAPAIVELAKRRVGPRQMDK